MIRKFKNDDITKVMNIWTKGNFEANYFIDKDYWLLKYNETKQKILSESDTYVFIKDDQIIGFISVLDKTKINSIFILKNFQRQGIGRKLINFCKERYDKLYLDVYEKNINAVLFHVAMGFINNKIQVDEETGEKEIEMIWNN